MMKKKLTSTITLVLLCITLAIGSSSFASTFTMFTLTPGITSGSSGVYYTDTGEGFVVITTGNTNTGPVEWRLFNHDTNTVELSGFVPPNTNFVLPFDLDYWYYNALSLSAACDSLSNPQPTCHALVELHLN